MRNLVCLAQHPSSHSPIRPVVWLFWVDSYQSNYLAPELFSSIGVEEALNAQCFGRMLISTFEQCSDYLKFLILIRPSLEKFLMQEKPIKNIALLGPGAGGWPQPRCHGLVLRKAVQASRHHSDTTLKGFDAYVAPFEVEC